MEQLTAFVSSRGILKACTVHNVKPVSSRADIDPDLLANHKAGGSIYVCSDALKAFAEEFLPLIRDPFVLVSGDSDAPINDSLLADPSINALVSSKLLLKWYAQNLSAHHPSLFSLPIGLDYHTMWEKPGHWGLTAVSPISQENSLINILAASPEFNQRYLAAYCNWHFAIGRGDRRECFEKIDRSVCLFETNVVTRNSSWLRQAERMFVVSPEGAGMDCHRTWEALLLGCIPIVKRNPISNLFADLPIIVVDDWAEANRDTMFEYVRTLADRRFDFSPLFRDYWMRKVAGSVTPILNPMTCAEFRQLLTRKTG